MIKVLFYSPIMEHPAVGGPQLRIENSVKALSEICQLDIINGDSNATAHTNDFFQRYSNRYHVVRRSLYGNHENRISVLLEKLLNKIFNIRLKSQAKLITHWVQNHDIELVWFGYGNISYALIKRVKKLMPTLKVVCDTDSVWSRFISREIPYLPWFKRLQAIFSAQIKEREERAWVNLCEVTTAVSEVDATYYRSLAKNKSSIHIFANAIDTSSYVFDCPPPNNFISPALYLSGSFGRPESSMNLAARWIIAEVLPLIQIKVPDCHLYIVGNNSDIEFGQLNHPNISVTGRIDSVLPYLMNASVAIVPLKFESGTRFKILEAGICKVPIVSTTLGAEGLDINNGVNILIADTAEEFSKAVIELIENRSMSSALAEECYKTIVEKYSIGTLKVQAQKIFSYLNLMPAACISKFKICVIGD